MLDICLPSSVRIFNFYMQFAHKHYPDKQKRNFKTVYLASAISINNKYVQQTRMFMHFKYLIIIN